MNQEMERILRDSEARYLTEDEQKRIVAFTSSLPQRFKAAAAVEQKEEVIIRWTIDQMRKLYPNFERFHARGWEKGTRDIQLALRYTVQAMTWNNLELQEEQLLTWLATILASFGFTPKFNKDTYTFLRDAVKQNIPADAYVIMEPYLSKNIEVLGSTPEPAVALV